MSKIALGRFILVTFATNHRSAAATIRLRHPSFFSQELGYHLNRWKGLKGIYMCVDEAQKEGQVRGSEGDGGVQGPIVNRAEPYRLSISSMPTLAWQMGLNTDKRNMQTAQPKRNKEIPGGAHSISRRKKTAHRAVCACTEHCSRSISTS